MSSPRHLRRLHRSFAAVESRYVRDLGRRERNDSPAPQPAAGPGYRGATERLDIDTAARSGPRPRLRVIERRFV